MMQCTIDAFLICLSVQASVVSFVLIGLERYLVICYGWQQHNRAILIMLLIAWTMAIGISATLVSSPDYIAMQHTQLSCAPNPTARQPLLVVMIPGIIGECFLAVFAILYCYYSIFTIYTENNDVKLKGVLSWWHTRGSEVARRSLTKNEQKILYKLVVMTSVFIFMITPFTISFLYAYHNGSNIIDDYPDLLWFDYFYGYLLALNSSTNSIMLYAMDPEVKGQIRSFFGITTKSPQIAEKPSIVVPPVISNSEQQNRVLVLSAASPSIPLAAMRMERRLSKNRIKLAKSTAGLFYPSTILSGQSQDHNLDSNSPAEIGDDRLEKKDYMKDSPRGSKMF